MGMPEFTTTLSAEFGSEPNWVEGLPCSAQILSGCTIRTCGAAQQDGGANTFLSSGRINISGGNLPITLQRASPTGMYAPSTVNAERFMTGDSVGFSGEGIMSGVPAWMATVSAPIRALAAAPAATPVVIARNQPYMARWTPSAGAPGKVAVILTVLGTGSITSAECRFDPAAGSGTIAPSVLALLPAGSGAVDLVGIDSTQVPAGTFQIEATVITVDDGSHVAATLM